MPISICCCYAHEDKALFDKLRKHLEPMRSSGIITTWHDGDILPGMEPNKEVTSSRYYELELHEIIKSRSAKSVILVLLRPFDWEVMLPFRLQVKMGVQIFPSDRRPVTSWRDREEAFWDITRGIRHTIETLYPEAEIQLPYSTLNDKTSVKAIRKILANSYRRAIFTQTSEEASYEDMLKSLGECRIFLQKNVVYLSSREIQAIVAEIIGELDFLERLGKEKHSGFIFLTMDCAKLRIIKSLIKLSNIINVPFVLPTSLTHDSYWKEGEVDLPPNNHLSPEHEQLLQNWKNEEDE